jgi:hypothetical protein
MEEHERQQRLEEAVRDAVARQQAKHATEQEAALRPVKRSQGVLIGILLASWAAMGWIWIARPAFVFGPTEGTRATTAEWREASLRFGLTLERGRIEQFVEETGRLPGTLEAAGEVEEGITWQRADSSYTLTGTDGDLILQLTDRMDADSFLGNSLDMLRVDR